MRRARLLVLLLCSCIISTPRCVQASALLQAGWDPARLPAADAALAGVRCNIDRRPKLTLEEFDRVYRDRRPVILGNRARVHQMGVPDLNEFLDLFGEHEVALHHPVRRGDVGIHKLKLRDHFAALTPVAGVREGDGFNIDAESEYLESSVSDRQLLDTNPEVHTWLLRRLYSNPDKSFDRTQARTTTQIMRWDAPPSTPVGEGEEGAAEVAQQQQQLTRPRPGMPTRRIAPESLCRLYSNTKLNCPCEVDMMVASPSGHGIAGHYHMTVQANLQVYGRKRWFFWRGPIPGGQNHRRSMREWVASVYPTLPEWMFRELSVPASVIRAVAPRLLGEEVTEEAVAAAIREGVEAAAVRAEEAGGGPKVPGWTTRLLEAFASDPLLAAVYLGLEEANSYPLGKAYNVSVPEKDVGHSSDGYEYGDHEGEEEFNEDEDEDSEEKGLDEDEEGEVEDEEGMGMGRHRGRRRRRRAAKAAAAAAAAAKDKAPEEPFEPGHLLTLPPFMHECTLEPGEMMYVPNGFYHATLGVGHEINLSFKCDSDMEKWYGQRTHESDHLRNRNAAGMWKPPPPPLPLASPLPFPGAAAPAVTTGSAPSLPITSVTLAADGNGLTFSYSGNVSTHEFGKKPPAARARPWAMTPWAAHKTGRNWLPRLYDRLMLRRGVLRLFTGLEPNMCSLNPRYLVSNGLNGTKVGKLQHLVNLYPEDPEGLYSLAAVYLRFATPVERLDAYEHKLLRLGGRARELAGKRALPRRPPQWVTAQIAEDEEAAATPRFDEWGDPLPPAPLPRRWPTGTTPAEPRTPEDVVDLRPPPPPNQKKEDDALAEAGLPPTREHHVELPREEWDFRYPKRPRWARQATILLESAIEWNPLLPEAYMLLAHGYSTVGLWLLSPPAPGEGATGFPTPPSTSLRRPPTPYSTPEQGYPPMPDEARIQGWTFLDQALAAATRAEQLEPHSGAACNAALELLAWGAVPGAFAYTSAGVLERVRPEEELLLERPTLGACASVGFDDGLLRGMPPGMSGECPALARRWVRQAVKCLSVGSAMLKAAVSYDCLQPAASELRLTSALLDWWAQAQSAVRHHPPPPGAYASSEGA